MDQFEIEKLKNAAENGRFFCIAVAFIMLFTGHPVLSFLMALPIGASIFVDAMPENVSGKASFIVYFYTVVVAGISLLNIIW